MLNNPTHASLKTNPTTNKTMESICCGSIFLSIGADLGYIWYNQWHFIEENLLCLPSWYQLQMASWSGEGLLSFFPFSAVEISSGLNPCKFCMCHHSFCEFIFLSVLLCLECVISLDFNHCLQWCCIVCRTEF